MSTRIEAIERTTLGKGGARKARRDGMVPAIMYGAIENPVSLAIKEKEFVHLLDKEGEAGLIELVIENDEGKAAAKQQVIIRQIDYDPETDRPIHVDFMAVAMDKKLTLSVTVELTGEASGVVVSKGTMSQITHELEIECLPGSIPHSIKVDVSGLEIGDSIHVSDLPEMEGVRILTGADHTIVTIEAPRVEEEVVEEVEEEAEAEPEVVGKEEAEETGESKE